MDNNNVDFLDENEKKIFSRVISTVGTLQTQLTVDTYFDQNGNLSGKIIKTFGDQEYRDHYRSIDDGNGTIIFR